MEVFTLHDEVLGKEPHYIMVFDNVLTPEQCEHIVQKFEHDTTKFVGTCGGHKVNPSIKQSTDLFLRSHEGWDIELKGIAKAILPKIMHYIDTYDQLQSMDLVHTGFQIQRSKEGQFYRTHIDDDTKESHNRMIATLLYLTDVEEGGETRFTQHGLQVKAKRGRLALFPAKWTHPHEARTVVKGTKYIAVGWLQPQN